MPYQPTGESKEMGKDLFIYVFKFLGKPDLKFEKETKLVLEFLIPFSQIDSSSFCRNIYVLGPTSNSTHIFYLVIA